MDDWIDYYDSTHTIYASRLHRDLHFELIARDIIAYITSADAVADDANSRRACRAIPSPTALTGNSVSTPKGSR